MVAGAYDSTLGRLRAQPPQTAPTGQTPQTPQSGADQGSSSKRITDGSAPTGATSIQNGPAASAGTTNGTIS